MAGTADASAVTARALEAIIEFGAAPEAHAWLRSLLSPDGSFARAAFSGRYAGAGRRFPGSLAVTPEQAAQLREQGLAAPERLTTAELARVWLLLTACAQSPAAEHVGLLTELFRRGDNLERSALLRALPLLPGAERFTELAIEACRTHVLDVFAAIACDNPFPARHFPELNFNQLVIKALFLELALERVVGWRARANSELRRIAHDYEAERNAAGRSVPEGIAAIKATEPVP